MKRNVSSNAEGSPRLTPAVRATVRAMQGYTPGEQPPAGTMIKLNTNENPFPPSPAVEAAWQGLNSARLRLYPDPAADPLRQAAAALYRLRPEQVIAGNGSDDLLTIGVRTFVDQGAPLLYTVPSYSLYPVLAQIQGARPVELPLGEDFQLPPVLPEELTTAPLLFIARPNAPTGTTFPRARIEQLCREFAGVVWIDEAYADFADDHCLDLIDRYNNVVVSRTLSKSYSLAGLRVGLAAADTVLIEQMLKVKDSYNLSWPAQVLAAAALGDQDYMQACAAAIKAERRKTADRLTELGFSVLPSQANFIFARPPFSTQFYLEELRRKGILVRYFPGPQTGDYVRITIGRSEEMESLLEVTGEIFRGV